MEAKMESSRAAPPPPNLGSLAKTFTKILRLRRAAAVEGGGGAGDGIYKHKASESLDGCYAVKGDGNEPTKEQKLASEKREAMESVLANLFAGNEPTKEQKLASEKREAMESVLANLFAGISAVKAAYAQLQVAQYPYDPEVIQSADQAVVSELKRLSELKHSYLEGQLHRQPPPSAQPALAAQIEEQGNLLKTYKITTRKLGSELQRKDSEIISLQSQLLASTKKNQILEARLHPGRSLAALDDLHLSGLNPTHFLTVLRYAVKSVRSFVKQLVQEMESAGWDLDLAAGAIHPGALRRRPGHRAFAFESYVCQKMFSNFQHPDFGLCAFADRHSWDRRRFFEEFTELMAMKPKPFLERIAKFCRAKYLGVVHPKMEASLHGGLEQRAVVSDGPGYPDSKLFDGFAEMARRVWLLQCLFFSFEPDGEAEAALPPRIFQVSRGCRFSEVYMESVAEDAAANRLTVGFTVVPGFRVGRTVIQCKVYLSNGP